MANPKRFASVPEASLSEAYQAIGRFITSVSDLDAAVTAGLAAILDLGEGGREILVHSIDFNRKREILKSLKGATPPESIIQKFYRLVDKANDKIMSRRHIVAHGFLAIDNGVGIIATLNIPAVAKYARNPNEILKVDELKSYSDLADTLTDEMFDIVHSIEDHRKSNEVGQGVGGGENAQ